jgi:Predicted hydrolases or acyltransferases (alpha/beta hydrolase superfamily)
VLKKRRAEVKWWIPRLVLAVVVGLSSGVAIDVWRVGGWQIWQIRHRLPPLYLARGSTIEVNGARAYLDCRGTGSPTVILEAGLGSGASGWGFVLEWVAAQTRVCAWDRPGIGGSDPIGHHTLEDTARHLRATLAAAGEEPPFIVVGHSLGGVYARVFASSFRPEVSGIVLVDPYLPDIRPVEHVALDEALREDWLSGLRATNDRVAAAEDLDWEASYKQLSAASIEGLPLELLFVDQRFRWEGPFDPAEGDLIAAWRRLLGGLSAEYRLTIAEDSTHMIQYDRPDLVVDAILRLVDRSHPGVGASGRALAAGAGPEPPSRLEMAKAKSVKVERPRVHPESPGPSLTTTPGSAPGAPLRSRDETRTGRPRASVSSARLPICW